MSWVMLSNRNLLNRAVAMKSNHLCFLIAMLFVTTNAGAQVGAQLGAQGADQKFQGFNLEGYNDDGQKSWDVTGETADVVGSQIKIKKVDANAYGDQNMNVTAETGVIDQQSGAMRLERDVTITNQEGAQMVTDTLQWDRAKDTVTTDDKVVISDDKMVISGKGMDAHPSLKSASIREDVRATVSTASDTEAREVDKVVITSEGPMVIDQTKSMAIFRDNVIAIQTDRTLKSDVMEVYFNPDMKGVDRIVCLGNVRIEQGDNQTYADRATYDGKTKKLTLSGRPKLILSTEGENGFASFGN